MRTRKPTSPADRIAFMEAAIAMELAAEDLAQAAREMQRLLRPGAKREPEPDPLDDYLENVRRSVVCSAVPDGNVIRFPGPSAVHHLVALDARL